MQKQVIRKNLTRFGNSDYVLIPRFVLSDWAKKLKQKVIKAVNLIVYNKYIEIKPLKEN